jgi:hypothetical protein
MFPPSYLFKLQNTLILWLFNDVVSVGYITLNIMRQEYCPQDPESYGFRGLRHCSCSLVGVLRKHYISTAINSCDIPRGYVASVAATLMYSVSYRMSEIHQIQMSAQGK